MNLICRECWNENNEDDWNEWCTEKQWNNKCKEQWALRQTNSGEHFEQRVRNQGHDAAVLDIGRRHPGQSKKLYRASLIKCSMEISKAITAGIKKLRADQQAKVKEQMQLWVKEWEQKAENPEYITKLDCKLTTSTHLMDFVDQILPGMDEYYMCRQRHCSMVCQAINWVNNHPNYQFRCPACGEQYRPWMSKPGYWPTNKVIFAYDEVNLQSGKAVVAPGSSDGPVGPNLVNIYPVVWPDTTTEQMKARIKAIFLDIDQDLLRLEPQARMTFVLENIRSTAPHKAFQHFDFLPSTRKTIDDLNDVLNQNKPRWQYNHVEDEGYWGLKLGEGFGLEEPLQQADYLRVWGLARWLEDCAVKSVLAAEPIEV
jgi:hypothetical protein